MYFFHEGFKGGPYSVADGFSEILKTVEHSQDIFHVRIFVAKDEVCPEVFSLTKAITVAETVLGHRPSIAVTPVLDIDGAHILALVWCIADAREEEEDQDQ